MLDLCLTLAEHSHQELSRKIAEYAGSIPLIEVRLDCLADPRLPELPPDSGTQFLATNRPRSQGGYYQGSEERRLELLLAAAEHGFSWIDLEIDVRREMDFPEEISVVRSFHSFQEFPLDLDAVLEDLQTGGGDVFKIAVKVSTTNQLKRLLLWMEGLPVQTPRVIIGMGVHGQSSRILGKFLGNIWTYVSAAEGDPAAPGQFSLRSARELYRIDQWETVPDLYGVIGSQVCNLVSARIHNRLFKHYNREALCLPLQLDAIEPWFDYMNATRLPFKGFSVTVPFQNLVGPHVHVPPQLKNVVDTLHRRGQEWIGQRTFLRRQVGGEEKEMILEQAAEQFRIWTGIAPDKDLMREGLDA